MLQIEAGEGVSEVEELFFFLFHSLPDVSVWYLTM